MDPNGFLSVCLTSCLSFFQHVLPLKDEKSVDSVDPFLTSYQPLFRRVCHAFKPHSYTSN